MRVRRQKRFPIFWWPGITALYLFVSMPVIRSLGTDVGQKSLWPLFHNRAGWSIAYPAGWKISSCQSCSDPTDPDAYVEFFPPSQKGYDDGWAMVEHLADKPSKMRADQWLSQITKTSNLNPVLEEKQFSLNDLPALEVVYRSRSDKAWRCVTTYIVADQQTFSLTFSGEKAEGPVDTLDNYPVYLQMLSSFKVKHGTPPNPQLPVR